MTLRNLADGEMIEVTAGWLDAKRRRKAFEANALLAAMLPSVQEAHDGLLAGGAPRGDAGRDAERAKLYTDGVALDRRHDRKGRAAFNLLSALVDFADDPAEAERYTALRKRLFPDENLSVLKASWNGEAGNARRLHEKVLGDKDASAELKAIPLPDKRTLLDRVKEFADAGQRLGALEDRRVALNAPASGEVRAAGTGAAARNRWISIVGNVVRLVDEVLRLPDAERHALLGSLDESERKADARELNRRGTDAPDETPATAPDGTSTPTG